MAEPIPQSNYGLPHWFTTWPITDEAIEKYEHGQPSPLDPEFLKRVARRVRKQIRDGARPPL